MLSPNQTATARTNTYALLSDIFLHGVTAVNTPTIQQTDLGERLPKALSFEELAAAHYHLLGLNVLPYESTFLSQDGMLGGEVAEAVQAAYLQMGLHLETTVSEPDHIGWELHALSFLCGAEADAWEDGLPAVALRLQHQQQRFLEQHLLRWVMPLVVSLSRQGNPFYAALAELMWGVLSDHYIKSETAVSFSLPPLPDLLEDKKAGLRDIVGVLIRPSFSGWLITRRDITALSRRLELPHGFGSREQMVMNLFRSAAQYEALDRLLVQLSQLADEWQAAYSALGGEEVTMFKQEWMEQNGRTVNLLNEMSNLQKSTSHF